jgi:hypothetical protein
MTEKKKPDDHLKLVASNTAPEDVFNNMEKLRELAEHKVKKKSVIINMPVFKTPPNTQHFQCHPDPEQRIDAYVVFDKDDRDASYYVPPDLQNIPLLIARMRKVTIATTCLWPSMQVGLWTVPFPAAAGKGKGSSTKCWKTARNGFEIAAGLVDERILRGDFPGITVTGPQWTNLCWNEDSNDYDLSVGEGINAVPIWSEGLKLQNSLKLAFRERVLFWDHDYVRQLRGLSE